MNSGALLLLTPALLAHLAHCRYVVTLGGQLGCVEHAVFVRPMLKCQRLPSAAKQAFLLCSDKKNANSGGQKWPPKLIQKSPPFLAQNWPPYLVLNRGGQKWTNFGSQKCTPFGGQNWPPIFAKIWPHLYALIAPNATRRKCAVFRAVEPTQREPDTKCTIKSAQSQTSLHPTN
jgi:hypothetical protein